MTTNIFTTAAALSDGELLTRIAALAGREREATAELVAHLAALEVRPSAYAAQGYGSLFGYCTQALRLSEDAACNRIDAARVCRLYPVVLDLLAAGSISLSCLRMLKPHLTAGNHRDVLARATNKTCKEVEALIAELAPRPDVVASVRRLPVREVVEATNDTGQLPPSLSTLSFGTAEKTPPATAREDVPLASAPNPAAHRPIVRASAPQRYRVQFTIGQEAHDKLRRVQALLRREIPQGDAGLIFEQALDLLLEKVEKAKLGAAARPGARKVIRRAADKTSRHIAADVKRAVWVRDRGQCAFVATTGLRCAEHTFLELHHVQPYALKGPATAANIALRCRRHNQYEAEVVFGPRRAEKPDCRDRRTPSQGSIEMDG
jgi:hypothetical protein